MLKDCRWVALEIKSHESVIPFYRNELGLELIDPEQSASESIAGTDRDRIFAIGHNTELRLRTPGGIPRGGLHTHFAFACPKDAYDHWHDRLSEFAELEEIDFGAMRSVYLFDPAGNCVEIAGVDPPTGNPDPSLTRIFEVVLEVSALDAAVDFYTDLGFDVVDRGADRRRTRLSTGEFDLELWEPHLGLANARGGVHVDIGLATPDSAGVVDRVSDRILARETVDSGVRIRDPDGHFVTFFEE